MKFIQIFIDAIVVLWKLRRNKIFSCNPNKLKFEYKNGEMYCKKCGSICKKYREKILVFIPYGIKKRTINIFSKLFAQRY